MKKSKKLVIGLTGGFCSGKTTAAKMLEAAGARLVDADGIGHAVLEPGTVVYRKITRRFGPSVISADGSINRRILGKMVFGDAAALKALNGITHPEIIRRVKRELSRIRKGVVVLDAPLLFETGLQRTVNLIVVVKSSRALQISRAMKKMRLDTRAAQRRIDSQMPLTQKVRNADFVIDNNGTRKNLYKQIEELRRNWWIS